jgi:hydrogenase nickel incorporation protein HypA/HybF
MHELSLMEQVLEIAVNTARQDGAEHIHSITLRVGKLSGVVAEALEFAFEALSADTIAEGGCLRIEAVPVICYCEACKSEFEPESIFYKCPACQQPSSSIVQGREFNVTAVEVS